MRPLRSVAFTLAAMLTVPSVACAAETGLAYDAVSRSGQGAARSEPGNFDVDFQAAQAPFVILTFDGSDPSKALAAMRETISRMAEVGMAGRYYVAGSKQRFDLVSFQRASITDCATRTIVQLDFKTKTYTTSSLDEATRRSATSAAIPSYSMKVTVEALGPKVLVGVPTDAYAATVAATLTPPGSSPMMMNFIMTQYLTKQTVTLTPCATEATIAAVRGTDNALGAAASGDQFAALVRGAQGMDPNVKTQISGTTWPTGRVPLFMTTTLQTVNGAAAFPAGFGASIEYGHFRPISSDDPVFAIPADFTKAPLPGVSFFARPRTISSPLESENAEMADRSPGHAAGKILDHRPLVLPERTEDPEQHRRGRGIEH